MQKLKVFLEEIKLVGINIRTNNASEMDPKQEKIPKTLNEYFKNQLGARIPNRLSPGNTYCVYHQYESDKNGMYSYFVGEKVDSFEKIPENLNCLTIPKQYYVQFHVGPGTMPEICIDAWKRIWKMNSEQLEGNRAYLADFEIHHANAQQPDQTEFSIYIGIKEPEQHPEMYLDPLIRASEKLGRFMQQLDTEQEQAGAIQAFEYCFELSWKLMRRLLKYRGILANSPREVFRASAADHIIQHPERWFDFLSKRNLTVHTYNEKYAQEVLSCLDSFHQEIQILIRTLQQ